MTSGAVTRYLRRMLSPPYISGLTDTQLLERFVSERDEAAFEILMWRHGPKVLGVCRRILHHEQDAEDAFQATFLVLVRKAGSISRRQSVGSWLYRVAYRVALRAKAKRPTWQTRVVDVLAADAVPDLDLWRVLDEEVDRLPEKYRAPFILCYLDGKTNEEAARELGCPTGTVKSRLAWARQRLRTGLARRGLALSAGMPGANAVVPAALVDSTLKTVSLGKAAFGPAAALSTGVLQTMLWTKVKIVSGCVLVVGALSITGGVVTGPMRGASQPAEVPQATLPASQLARVAETKTVKPDKAETPQPKEDSYAFEFRNEPWANVFELLSDQTGLPLLLRAKPTGTLTFLPPRADGVPKRSTLGEVIDTINWELFKQNLILIRRPKMFTVEPTDARIELNSLPEVSLDELRNRGNTELVCVQMPLSTVNPRDLLPVVSTMVGKWGEVGVLAQGSGFSLRDTAANLRHIYQALKEMESGVRAKQGQRKETGRTGTSPEQPKKRLAFEMRDKPWIGAKDSVLEWLSDQTGLPVSTSNAKPTGTLTFINPRLDGVPKQYSLPEVIDILNAELLKQRLVLVRGDKTFIIAPAEEKKSPQGDSVTEKLDRLLNRLDTIEKRLDSLERSAKSRETSPGLPK